ncbi:hypothetical protein PR048_027116 [Dryococelus australis]|uniref:Carboxylesterase type B domain-containing protein n=1 Tax=Dryococelus australis TaxID=614101 RepID=A0ABQ9GEJ2_9NEOP|nr:hypothetical protein PR048_027116 [Dryococelus australis]
MLKCSKQSVRREFFINKYILLYAVLELENHHLLCGEIFSYDILNKSHQRLVPRPHTLFADRYDLLYGVTELESYHLLGGVALSYGLLERERDQLLHSYFQDKFQFKPDVALAETLKEYTDWRQSQSRPMAEEHRDVLLDILSDARVVAPLVKTANFHSSANPKSYFYVFTHKSLFGDFADGRQHESIHGEELPYVFGVAVDGDDSHFHQAYNLSENLFSEAVMTFWTNFAHTGDEKGTRIYRNVEKAPTRILKKISDVIFRICREGSRTEPKDVHVNLLALYDGLDVAVNPNAPKRFSYLTHSRKEWQQYDIDWPEYDVKNQSYITLGIPPKTGHHYRKKTTSFWNEVLPKLLVNPGDVDSGSVPQISEPSYEAPKQPPEPPPRFPATTRRPLRPPSGRDKYENFYKPTEDGSKSDGVDYDGIVRSHPVDEAYFPGGKKSTQQELPQSKDKQSADSSGMALGIVIVVGVVFLVVNLSACVALYYQTHRLKAQEDIMRRRFEDADEEEYGTRRRVLALEEIVVHKHDTKEPAEGVYEAVSGKKTQQGEGESSSKRWRLSRQCSASTMDPHTKVREWIAQEIVQKCSPRFLRKAKLHHHHQQVSFEDQVPPSTSTESHPTATTSRHGMTTNSQRSRAFKKVSVAVDATPSARTASILKQTPIEVSKSLDQLGSKCVSTSMLTLSRRPSLKRCATAGENLAVASTSPTMAGSSPLEVIRRSSSINFKVYTPPLQFQNTETVPIEHHHSRSDPDKQTSSYCSQADVSKLCSAGDLAGIHLDKGGEISRSLLSTPTSQLRSFSPSTPTKHSILKNKREVENKMTSVSNLPVNINVTSRDSTEANEMCSSTDRLATIQKRNFPKVLPDFPSDQEDVPQETRELSPVQAVAAKRRSLPISGNLQLGLTPLGETGSVSQPTTPTSGSHKDIQTQTTNGRVPPPPPPRVSSTLGRKPSNNSSPVIPTTIDEPLPDKERIPFPSSPVSTSSTHIARPEPKVIIKPTTSTRKMPANQNIPRVTPKTHDYPLKPPHPTMPKQETPAAKPVSEKKVPQASSSTSGPIPVPVPKVPGSSSPKKGSAASKASKKSSGTSTDESGSNTGTVKRGKKPSDGKGEGKPQTSGGKSWYAQYSQSFLSRSKEDG